MIIVRPSNSNMLDMNNPPMTTIRLRIGASASTLAKARIMPALRFFLLLLRLTGSVTCEKQSNPGSIDVRDKP